MFTTCLEEKLVRELYSLKFYGKEERGQEIEGGKTSGRGHTETTEITCYFFSEQEPQVTNFAGQVLGTGSR